MVLFLDHLSTFSFTIEGLQELHPWGKNKCLTVFNYAENYAMEEPPTACSLQLTSHGFTHPLTNEVKQYCLAVCHITTSSCPQATP